MTENLLTEGAPAPDFVLDASSGAVSQSALHGRILILYFYPKADTSGCTAEARDFQERLNRFAGLGAVVLGISRDALPAVQRFAAKHQLSFTLASDPEGKAASAYGVWVEKSMYGRRYMGVERTTFLVDRGGIIRRIWRKVKVPGHADQVLAAVTELCQTA
jgi:thioredoxin-dependent peroxiredoxin